MTRATVGQRAAAYLLDWVDEPLVAVATAVWLVGYGPLGIAAAGAWTIWILAELRSQARTGQTFGKRVVGIAIVDSTTFEPLGGRRTALRWGVKSVDTLLPIRWLRSSRTFGDELTGSIAVVSSSMRQPT